MRNDRDELLRCVERENEPAEPAPMDAAESRWDPWLLALAKLEVQRDARPN